MPPAASIAPIYFISDLHLGVGDPETERHKLSLLLTLLGAVRDERADLYIVGDLFDFWYEYRSVVPRGYHGLYAAIDQLRGAGCAVTYLAGNHDFAIGDFFSRDLDVTVIRDDHTFVAQGRHFSLAHGDGLAVRDGGYRLLKRVLRASLSQRLFRLLHPDCAFGIARRFSHGSRDYTSGRDFGEDDGMRIDAARRISAGADIVVMGHRHLPCIEPVGTGLYVNLGDWIGHYTYAVCRNGDIRLYTIRHGYQEPYV
ncbi:MAG: UDP-2,3-diacylglucosamine diphosphatase [Bacteroidota bacterium]|jgi:UDP-2,3-diacylglucosamine hydrolase|nr:UDP-2,3-diacylglucosamine diphosphatase [Bacteroidota bacterium]